MKRTFALLAAATIALAPAAALAVPGGNHGSTNDLSVNRQNSPAHDTRQPNASCEETPNTPGNSASAPGSAFNPDGKAGTVYAGEQPQNSRNTHSVSQYDVACTHQPN
jgi:hypothetical protein